MAGVLRRSAQQALGRLAAQQQARYAAAASAASAQAAMVDELEYGEANEVEGKVYHPKLMNKFVLDTQYAVRGELYLRAEQLRREGKEIIFTNVGNPHALGQPPITFARQVAALCTAPFLLDDPKTADLFPADAIERARKMLTLIPGGVGAYSDSRGSLGIRKEVAEFIERRDGFPSDPDRIFLTDGASVAIRSALNGMLRTPKDAVCVPVPQYPLYSASISLYGGTMLGYYLDEDKGWALSIDDIKRSMEEHRAGGGHVRALCFINPGNPTGQCLSKENLAELAKFAYDEKIVLMADEVYQDNIYQDARPFVSMKSVLMGLGEPYASGVELLSFHTVSKGYMGECGLRGGYVEFTNIDDGAIDQLYKISSINLSPNVQGQVSMSLMVNPPKPGEPSYPKYKEEKDEAIASLRRRSHMMTDAFNSLEGVTCNFTEGAMYSFPRVRLPAKAMKAAEEAGKSPDVFYCLRLLEETGISGVPGSGFGQQDGTFHFRTTILPNEGMMPEIIRRFQKFHAEFMDKYRD